MDGRKHLSTDIYIIKMYVLMFRRTIQKTKFDEILITITPDSGNIHANRFL